MYKKLTKVLLHEISFTMNLYKILRAITNSKDIKSYKISENQNSDKKVTWNKLM